MDGIAFDNVCFSYPGKDVLKGLTFSVPAGARAYLSGPSGSGKTTVLRLACGLEPPLSGSVRPGAEGRVSFMFQEDRLFPFLTAPANVRFAAGAGCDLSVLRDLGFTDADLKRPVREFSGGMKRRVALARALVSPYDVLLLDEPFTGMDEALVMTASRLILERSEGRTVLFTSHTHTDVGLLAPDLRIEL